MRYSRYFLPTLREIPADAEVISHQLMLRAGIVDAVFAGGSDSVISPLGIGSLDRSGAMSHRDGDSPQAPQPFDLNRDGFVMGEGAAVLLLEREAHAIQRKAHIYAELAGYGSTADAFHITAPLEDGHGSADGHQKVD